MTIIVGADIYSAVEVKKGKLAWPQDKLLSPKPVLDEAGPAKTPFKLQYLQGDGGRPRFRFTTKSHEAIKMLAAKAVTSNVVYQSSYDVLLLKQKFEDLDAWS
jgi:hypothetical protein